MKKLKGVIPPMITPFTEDGAVDQVSLQVLVEYLREQVDGLFITGSYGAGAMMSIEERKTVTEQSVRFCGGKVPVITMVGTTSTHESVILSRHAETAGRRHRLCRPGGLCRLQGLHPGLSPPGQQWAPCRQATSG